ncbi:hypothetical protein EWM64_g10817 [Hericium alpestre]|uniref:Uncharacterized protein n=1 Tax=Hericium alpestre TaxID=135208 RepID=A0A4Y9ZEJ3_9AGAM|nr:hypothetical protein EWM64_g10817 [Hericium alpestre]
MAGLDRGPDTVKLTVWELGDLYSQIEPAFLVTLPADLETVRDWRPDYHTYPPEDVEFPSLLRSLYFPQYEDCSRLDERTEDVEGKSRDMAKLFSPYFQNRRQIYATLCNRFDPLTYSSMLLEITVAKKRPESGSFCKVQICCATLHKFAPLVEGCGVHPLHEQGYRWATAVDIDRDPVKLGLVHLLMQWHLLDIVKIYPPLPDEAGSVLRTDVL